MGASTLSKRLGNIRGKVVLWYQMQRKIVTYIYNFFGDMFAIVIL